MSNLLQYPNCSWHQPTTFYLSLRAIDHTSAMPRELLIFTLSGLPLSIALGIGFILFLAAFILAVSVVLDGLKYPIGLFLCLVGNCKWTPTTAPIELPAIRVGDRTECSGQYPASEPIELPAIRAGDRSDWSRRHPAPEVIELSTEGAQNCSDNSRQESAPSPVEAPSESEGGWSDVSNHDQETFPVDLPTESGEDWSDISSEESAPEPREPVDLPAECDDDWSDISSQHSAPEPREPKTGPQIPYPMACILLVSGGKAFRVRGIVYPTDGRATIFRTKKSDLIILFFPGGKGCPELEAGLGRPLEVECQCIPKIDRDI